MKKHQVITAMVACGMLLAALAGCAGQETPDASATPMAEPSASASPTPGKDVRWPSNIDFGAMEGKTITTRCEVDSPGNNLASIQTVREEFSQRFGVKFEDIDPSGYQKSLESVTSKESWWMLNELAFLVSTGRSPTIIAPWKYGADLGNLGMPQAAAMGLVQPVDRWIDARDSTFLQDVLDGYRWEGNRYCLQYYEGLGYPKGSGVISVIYNLTAMLENGIEPPFTRWEKGEWTWDALRSISKSFNVYDEKGSMKSCGFIVNERAIGAALAQAGALVCRVEEGAYQVGLKDDTTQAVIRMFGEAIQSGDFIYNQTNLEEKAMLLCQSWEIGDQYFSNEKGTSIKSQAVPLPAVSGKMGDERYAVLPMYYMIGKNCPNPEVGFAWLWYRGNYYEDARLGALGRNPYVDDEGKLRVKEFSDELEAVQDALIGRIMENGQLVPVSPYKGYPGVAPLFNQFCNDVFKGNLSLKAAVDVYEPKMEAKLLAFVSETVPILENIPSPQIPKNIISALEGADQQATITPAGNGLAITIPNPEKKRLELDAAKLGQGAFFPAWIPYQCTLRYKVLEGMEHFKGLEISLRDEQGNSLADFRYWDALKQEGGEFAFQLVHANKTAEKQASLYIRLVIDGGPFTLQITDFQITGKRPLE
nr:hypothetical protein [bacterium]